MFANNIAISGAAVYFKEIHSVQSDNADIKFINNSATEKVELCTYIRGEANMPA